MNKWETDPAGWKMLLLPKGWLFVIDPSFRENAGYDIYLLKQTELLMPHHLLTTHGSLKHASSMCEKLRTSGRWKQYTVPKPKESKWHTSWLSSVISPAMLQFFTTWSKRSLGFRKSVNKT